LKEILLCKVTEVLGNPGNGNFLGQIELVAKYSLIMAYHIWRASKPGLLVSYSLLPSRMNEFTISDEILNVMKGRILYNGYCSVTLDCTTDMSQGGTWYRSTVGYDHPTDTTVFYLYHPLPLPIHLSVSKIMTDVFGQEEQVSLHFTAPTFIVKLNFRVVHFLVFFIVICYVGKRINSACTVQGSGSSWGESCCLRDSLVGIVYSTGSGNHFE
jgi:hypothetical protein